MISRTGYRRDSPHRNRPFNLIPSDRISMSEVDYPVMGSDGIETKLMFPGEEHQFTNPMVAEVPVKGLFALMSQDMAANGTLPGGGKPKALLDDGTPVQQHKEATAQEKLDTFLAAHPEARGTEWEAKGRKIVAEQKAKRMVSPAKGTPLIFQDGGSLDEHQAFLKNWYENRQIPDDYIQEAYELDKPAYLEKAKSFAPYVNVVKITDDPNITGRYEEKNKRVLLTPRSENYVKTHEQNHYLNSDGSGEYMRTIHNDIVNNEVKSQSEMSNQEYKDHYNQIADPDEVHSRIMVLRKQAGIKPDQVVDEKFLDNFFKQYDGKNTNINDLIEISKSKGALLNMLNYMASNEKSFSQNTARKGGEMNKNAFLNTLARIAAKKAKVSMDSYPTEKGEDVLEYLQQGGEPEGASSKPLSFGEAFSRARRELGPDATFEFNGKRYTTAMAGDKPSAQKADSSKQTPVKNNTSKPVADTSKKELAKIPRSGVVIDKRTNTGYYYNENGKSGSFPVLTGYNQDSNDGSKSEAEKDRNPNARVTPRGGYIMNTPDINNPDMNVLMDDGTPYAEYLQKHYKGQMRGLTPIEMEGMSKAEIENVALHRLYSNNTDNPLDSEYLRRLAALKGSDVKKKCTSWGCVNLADEDYTRINEALPDSDTLVVLDSKLAGDRRLLDQVKQKVTKTQPKYTNSFAQNVVSSSLRSNNEVPYFMSNRNSFQTGGQVPQEIIDMYLSQQSQDHWGQATTGFQSAIDNLLGSAYQTQRDKVRVEDFDPRIQTAQNGAEVPAYIKRNRMRGFVPNLQKPIDLHYEGPVEGLYHPGVIAPIDWNQSHIANYTANYRNNIFGKKTGRLKSEHYEFYTPYGRGTSTPQVNIPSTQRPNAPVPSMEIDESPYRARPHVNLDYTIPYEDDGAIPFMGNIGGGQELPYQEDAPAVHSSTSPGSEMSLAEARRTLKKYDYLLDSPESKNDPKAASVRKAKKIVSKYDYLRRPLVSKDSKTQTNMRPGMSIDETEQMLIRRENEYRQLSKKFKEGGSVEDRLKIANEFYKKGGEKC